jgi:hypothetical protein
MPAAATQPKRSKHKARPMAHKPGENVKPPPAVVEELRPERVFDAARIVFLAATSQMLRADELSPADKQMEIESTIRTLRQMGLLEGLRINV